MKASSPSAPGRTSSTRRSRPTTSTSILHKLQDLGYDGVELGSFGPHPSPASHPTKASRQKLKKEIADHGLALSGIAVDLWAFKTPGTSILDENPARVPDRVPRLVRLRRRPRRQDDPRRYGRCRRTTSRPTRARRSAPKAGMERHRQRLGQGSKIAADYGMNICWEFEPGFVFNKPSEIVQDRRRGAGEGQHELRRALRHLPRPHVRGRRRQPDRARRRRCPAASWSCWRSSRGRSPTST